LTGEAAEEYSEAALDSIKDAKVLLGNGQDLGAAIQKLVSENSDYKKKAEEFAKQKAAQFAKDLAASAVEADGRKVILLSDISGYDPAILRDAATLLQKETNTAMAAAYEYEGKPQLLLMYSADLAAAGKNAGKEIREAARFIQGGGGGQNVLATAGGRNVEGLGEALKVLEGLAKA
ncbi:MAG: DHHA1 domain-containing protein, partial [Bacteroidales bacterium]|nr:DHHA1 domain-containing protein [Bacteroidales bacterium]